MAGSADGQPVIIRELGGELRTVTLEGPDLPERGLEVGVSLRQTTTRYPNGATSVQLHGSEEEPIELRCTFSDSLTGIDEGAISQVETLRSILLGQQPVEFSWGALLVRRGYLLRVTPRYVRESLIECAIEVLPVESDEPFYLATPYQRTTASDVTSWMDLLSDALDAANTAAALWTGAAAVFT